MYMKVIVPAVFFLLLVVSESAFAQKMTMEEAISTARSQSVLALEARASFISDYWAWRSYLGSRLPMVSVYGEIGSFDRSLSLVQRVETGEMLYTTTFNMQNSLGLRIDQNLTATGGTLTLYSNLNRLDQFGTNSGTTWYAQPVTLSYSQPLFSYNRFKWDKRISPKEYEKARRVYMESMEDVTLEAVEYFFDLMEAKVNHDVSLANHDKTSRMLRIARARMNLGTVTRDEYLQLELRQLKDSIAIQECSMLLRKAQMQFNSLVGFDESHEVEPVLDDRLPDITIDYNQVLEKCAGNSSFYLQNEINELNAESAIAQAKANRGLTMQLYAKFGLSNSAGSLSRTYSNLLDQEIVGLSFSIPIFDWGAGKGRVKKAQAAAEVIRAQVEQSENDKRISLFNSVGQFNNQRRQCTVSSRANVIAQERYTLVMEKFRRGKATVNDLNTARSESDEAQRQYISDIYGFWRYYYTLRKLTLFDFIEGHDIDVSFKEMTE